MTEQLSLFTIQPVIKSVHDPYWDEIVQPTSEAFTSIDEGDSVDAVSSFVGIEDSTKHSLVGLGHVTPSLFTTENVRAQDTQQPQTTPKLAPEHFAPEHTHWTEDYWVKRGNKKHYYYRYCWMVGTKKHRIHIGSVTNPVARAKREEVEIAIADGDSPVEIKHLIQSWSGK